jgi:hypothetical protein
MKLLIMQFLTGYVLNLFFDPVDADTRSSATSANLYRHGHRCENSIKENKKFWEEKIAYSPLYNVDLVEK